MRFLSFAIVASLAAATSGCTFVTIRTGAVEFAALKDTGTPRDTLEDLGPVMQPGERIEANVGALGITVGSFALQAEGPPCRLGDATVLRLHAEAHSEGLAGVFGRRWAKTDAWVEAASGQPVLERTELSSGGKHKLYFVDHRPDGYRVRYERTQGDETRVRDKTWSLPAEAQSHGVVTALMALRRWRPDKAGHRANNHVVIGTRIWRGDFVYRGRKRLRGVEGVDHALLIEGLGRKLDRDLTLSDRAPRTMTLYLSEDDRRVPLRAVVQDGSMSVEVVMTKYQPGKPSASTEPDLCRGIPPELRP